MVPVLFNAAAFDCFKAILPNGKAHLRSTRMSTIGAQRRRETFLAVMSLVTQVKYPPRLCDVGARRSAATLYLVTSGRLLARYNRPYFGLIDCNAEAPKRFRGRL